MLSIITISHRPTHLREAYASLQRQTCLDFEWVLVANGDESAAVMQCARQLIAQETPRFREVRIHASAMRCRQGGPCIGALKNEAFNLARGDLLVELDHDDVLLPDCLECLRDAANGRNMALIYSDTLLFSDERQVPPWRADHGWRFYPLLWNGKMQPVMIAFPATARSLCEIYYAPDHVRAWTADAYRAAGGHDVSMQIGDDHDLVCRTYLSGADFIHVSKPLYGYRFHDGNLHHQRAGDISRQQRENCRRHLPNLIKEWCRRHDLPMFDLGGAHNPAGAPYRTVDRCHADLCCDLLDADAWPFPRDSVGCFRAADFLEHVPIGQVVPLLNRLYDSLAPGGWLLTSTPSVSGPHGEAGRGAYQDPTHCSFWAESSWWYYTDGNYARYVPEIRCRFQPVRLETLYPSDWHRQNYIPYVVADLVAVKDGERIPGPIRI